MASFSSSSSSSRVHVEEAVVLATYKKGKDSRGNVQVHAQEQVWVAVDGEGVYGYGEGVDARSSRGQGRNWLVKPNVVFTAGAGPRQHPTTGQVWVAVDREGDKEGDGMRPLASNVLRAFQKDKTNDTAMDRKIVGIECHRLLADHLVLVDEQGRVDLVSTENPSKSILKLDQSASPQYTVLHTNLLTIAPAHATSGTAPTKIYVLVVAQTNSPDTRNATIQLTAMLHLITPEVADMALEEKSVGPQEMTFQARCVYEGVLPMPEGSDSVLAMTSLPHHPSLAIQFETGAVRQYTLPLSIHQKLSITCDMTTSKRPIERGESNLCLLDPCTLATLVHDPMGKAGRLTLWDTQYANGITLTERMVGQDESYAGASARPHISNMRACWLEEGQVQVLVSLDTTLYTMRLVVRKSTLLSNLGHLSNHALLDLASTTGAPLPGVQAHLEVTDGIEAQWQEAWAGETEALQQTLARLRSATMNVTAHGRRQAFVETAIAHLFRHVPTDEKRAKIVERVLNDRYKYRGIPVHVSPCVVDALLTESLANVEGLWVDGLVRILLRTGVVSLWDHTTLLATLVQHGKWSLVWVALMCCGEIPEHAVAVVLRAALDPASQGGLQTAFEQDALLTDAWQAWPYHRSHIQADTAKETHVTGALETTSDAAWELMVLLAMRVDRDDTCLTHCLSRMTETEALAFSAFCLKWFRRLTKDTTTEQETVDEDVTQVAAQQADLADDNGISKRRKKKRSSKVTVQAARRAPNLFLKHPHALLPDYLTPTYSDLLTWCRVLVDAQGTSLLLGRSEAFQTHCRVMARYVGDAIRVCRIVAPLKGYLQHVQRSAVDLKESQRRQRQLRSKDAMMLGGAVGASRKKGRRGKKGALASASVMSADAFTSDMPMQPMQGNYVIEVVNL